MKTTIKIADINSTGIQHQAKLDGVTEVTHIGSNHKGGDERCEMYDFGGVRVMTTNGDPIWEEQDAIAFAEHMEWAGVEIFDADTPAPRYINISEKWGDAVEVVPSDYRAQAAAFGLSAEGVEVREDGIYISGEQVARVQEAE